jgi:hypothetical protein
MASTTTDVNLAKRAIEGKLTVEEVNAATKETTLETDERFGLTVLCCASLECGTEVVEAIINKGVDINGLSGIVSIVIIIYYD